MIKYVDQRCRDWALAVSGFVGIGYAAQWSQILAGTPLCGAGDGFSPEVIELETMVCRLELGMREVVMVRYLGPGNAVDCAKRLHVSRATFFNMVDQAHVELDRMLSDNFFKKSIAID